MNQRWALVVASALLWSAGPREITAQSPPWKQLASPQVEGAFVRPAAGSQSQPLWGHARGLQVGLAPLPGPRGLLRIYAPYLGHEAGRMINFVAVEPIVEGERQRGYSELEPSRLDGVRGKRFWSVNDPQNLEPRLPERPARGVISQEHGVECLEVYVLVEAFRSGAHPYLKLRFQSDRPREVGISVYAHKDSKSMRTCILTATMGNFARLRRLHLADETILSTDLWPGFDGDGFTGHKRFPLERLSRTPAGHAVVSATSNERDPQQAQYAPGTFGGWKYRGKPAVQYWRCETARDTLCVQVNGRSQYWASSRPIPGGVSFENFEMVDRFQDGQQFWFGVKPIEGEP